jgi:predicted ATPase/DNA-binding SARP family transcriptional activator
VAYPGSVRVGVLGPVVVVHDGHPHPPPTPVARALLGALAVDAPLPVGSGKLIETVWPVPPRDPKAALQLAVHRLRGWLRDAVGDGVAVLSGPAGYRLHLAGGETDLALFRALAGADQTATLSRALDLWRGAPLEDVPPERRDETVLVGLVAERAAVTRRCAAAVLAGGQAERALELVRPLCAADPLDEEAHAILVEALAAAGRLAAALAEYDRVRRSLAADLGIDPGVRLQEAYQKVLHPVAGAAPTPQPAPARWRGPRPHVDLVGRDGDREAAGALLARHRIVTLAGPGGVGKTVLALDLAGAAAGLFDLRRPKVQAPGQLSLADGVVVASLVAADDAAGVTLILGNLLGIPGGRPDEIVARAEEALAGRHLLVVLDNCEHVLAAVAGLAARLIAAAPGVVVLATSRQPLGISGEVVYQVRPLPAPAPRAGDDQPAVALFLRRATEAVPTFRATPDALPQVAAICRRLDGLPLAIELAAARLRTFPLETLAKQLADDLGLLFTGVRGADPRHGALAATIDWSYRLLDPTERRLLTRLSVFRGGFTLGAAIAVCDEPPVASTLVALVERSLVQPYDAADGRRYLLLEAVREFAAQRLADSGGTAGVRDRHLDYWLAFARRLHAWTADYPRWETAARTHAADSGNLRAALEHGYDSGRVLDAVELTALLFDFWIHGGHPAEAERWLRKAEPHLPAVPAPIRSVAQFNLAIVEMRRDRLTDARRLVRQALPDLRRHHPDEADEATMFALGCHVRQLDPIALDLVPPMLARISRTAGGSRRVRAVCIAVEVLTAWGRLAEAAELGAELAAGLDSGAEQIATFVGHHRSVALLSIDLCLDRPVCPDAYRGLLDHGDGDGDTAPSPLSANANLALSLLVLGTGRLDPYRGVLLRSMAALVDRHHGTRTGIARPSIYLAEAERRAGHPYAALGRLRPILGWAIEGGNLQTGCIGAVVAALIAADLGDTAAATTLIQQWDECRQAAGLAAPAGLAGAVADRFGLDRATPGRPAAGYAWRAEPFEDLIRAAEAWCGSGISVPEPVPQA